jgi:hypothetical protein
VKQSQMEQKIADQNILLLNVLAEVRLFCFWMIDF